MLKHVLSNLVKRRMERNNLKTLQKIGGTQMDSLIRKFRSWTRTIINVRQWAGLRVQAPILFRCMLLFLILSLGVYLFAVPYAQAADNFFTDKVGIGITEPTEELHVIGDSIVSGTGSFGTLSIGITDPGIYALYVNGDTYLGGITVTDGILTFGGALDMQGSDITDVGTITADTLTDGTLVITGGDLSTTGTVQAEHLYSTDDIVADGNIEADHVQALSGLIYNDLNMGNAQANGKIYFSCVGANNNDAWMGYAPGQFMIYSDEKITFSSCDVEAKAIRFWDGDDRTTNLWLDSVAENELGLSFRTTSLLEGYQFYLGKNDGSTYLRVRDSDNASVFSVSDDGDVTATGIVQAEHLYSTDDIVADGDIDVTGNLVIGGTGYFDSLRIGSTAAPTVALDVIGETLITGSAGAAGSAATDALIVTGGTGGAASPADTGTGQKGSDVAIATGAGGIGGSTSGNAGNGGDIELTTAAGGTAAGSGDAGSYGNVYLAKNGGYIRIGSTATPTKELDIAGDVLVSGTLTAGTLSLTNYTTTGVVEAGTLTDGTLSITDGALSTTGTGTFGDLVVDTNTLVVNAAGYTDKVGIGTATPNNLFQVTDLLSFTNADYATSIGYQAGKYDLGQYNTYIGYQAGSADNSTGKTDVADRNTGVGYQALYSNTTGNYNSAQGMYALRSNTIGSNNSAQGYEAGKFIADGATGNTIGSNSVFLGYKTKALADGQTNQIVIGSEATGVGSNSVVLGNDSIVTTILKGDVTVPQLIDSGLTASLGVYTDASKQLTSTAPATGDLGFWNKTGTTLIPATSGDGVFINGHVGIGSGSAVPTTSIVNIAETLTATQTHGVEIVPTRLGADNINITGVWLTPGVSTDADHLFTKSLTGMAGYSIGGGTSFGVGANLIGLSFGNYLGTFGAGGSVNLSTKGIDVFSSWGYAVTATIKNGIGLYVDNIRAPNNYTIEEYACGIYIAPDSSNIASAPQIHQMYIGKPTKATANYQLSLGSYGAGSGVFFDMEAPGTASTPQRIYSDGTNLNVDSPIIMQDKVIFTQTDGDEYIDSLADGYLDGAATTGIRLTTPLTSVSANLDVDGTADIEGQTNIGSGDTGGISTYKLGVRPTITTNGFFEAGIYVPVTLTPASTFTGTAMGIGGFVYLNNTDFGAGTVDGLRFGPYCNILNAGNAALNLTGIRTFGVGGYRTAGTNVVCNDAAGAIFSPLATMGTAGMNITANNGYGVKILTSLAADITSMTNQYGLYIENIANATNNYQVSLAGNGVGTGIWFDSAERLYSDDTNLVSAAPFLALDKIKFTQTDGDEYIDSLADGYMDYGATTQHRFNNDINIVGDCTISGALSKGSGTFLIDHPLDPKNKILRHSFTESPEMMNIYKGRAKLVGGKAVVELPDYFDALNAPDAREINLTCVGAWSPLYLEGEIADNKFVVRTKQGGKQNQEFSWVIYAVRNDPFAQQNPVIVEQEKGLGNSYTKGEYIHSEAYEQMQKQAESKAKKYPLEAKLPGDKRGL